MWCIYTIKYLAIKRNKILIHATTRMNPQSIMQRERGLSQKAIYYSAPLI